MPLMSQVVILIGNGGGFRDEDSTLMTCTANTRQLSQCEPPDKTRSVRCSMLKSPYSVLGVAVTTMKHKHKQCGTLH